MANRRPLTAPKADCYVRRQRFQIPDTIRREVMQHRITVTSSPWPRDADIDTPVQWQIH